MKGHLVYFVHLLVCHHGGFKVRKSPLEPLFLFSWLNDALRAIFIGKREGISSTLGKVGLKHLLSHFPYNMDSKIDYMGLAQNKVAQHQ